MSKPRWHAFPNPDRRYDYPDAALRKHWHQLHQGDREPYPEASSVQRLIAHAKRLTPLSAADAAAALQDAWRAYHRGDFADAVALGLCAGPLGYNVANKATNIYATYLEPDVKSKLDLFQASARRAEELQSIAPALVNAWYFHGQAVGRYSQGISIAAALARGLAGKVRKSLERAIALDPDHAEAHIALGAFHAEVVGKMGAIAGGLTYGASKEASLGHFRTALRLMPRSAIARIEYANALATMFGRSRMAEATRLCEEAASFEPADAMERLDVELAKSELAGSRSKGS